MSEDSGIEPIQNKVAGSGLITLNLEDYYHRGERILFDVKPWLFKELILKEEDFRAHIRNHDWSQYAGKNIAFSCTSDAIVPTWAYMLLAIAAEPFANRYVFGDIHTLETVLFQDALRQINPADFADARVIVKGCGDIPIAESAYVEIVHKLMPVVKSIMYGEACSNVPLYKRK